MVVDDQVVVHSLNQDRARNLIATHATVVMKVVAFVATSATALSFSC